MKDILAKLLKEAEAAHAEYERDVLGGGRDANWADWYAEFITDKVLQRLEQLS